MLVNIHHDSRREHNRLLVAGVAFLTVIALLIGFSIAVYQKKFDRRHDGDDPGRPRRPPAREVRRRPHQRRPGRARSASVEPGRQAGGHQGRARAGRRRGDPRERRACRSSRPRCSARSSSRSSRPTNPAGRRSQDGDVIPADRVETNVELSRILADLFPLLRAVRPADLNYTLNALATALEGRGEQLGETLDELDAYLGAISDKLPTLQQDLISLAERRRHLRPGRAGPDRGARQPHGDQQDDRREGRRPRRLLLRPRGPGRSPRRGCCRTTRQNLIRVGEVTEPVLKLLAIYSPEFPCLHQGRRRVRAPPGHDLRGQPGQAVHRVRHRPVRGLPRRRPPAVRRGRPRPLVRRPAQPQGPGRTRRRSTRARTSTRTRPPATCPRSSPAVPRGPHDQRLRRHRRPRRRSSTRCSPARPAAPPTRTAPSGRCSTARSSGAVTRDHDAGAAAEARPERSAKLRNRRNAATSAAGIKLGIFTIVSILVTGLLAAIMGNFGFGDGTEYQRGVLHRVDAGEGRRRPGGRRQRRRGQEGRAPRAQPGAGDVPGQVRGAAHDRLARRDPLPQPGRRPLPRARGRARDQRTPSALEAATPSRSSQTSPGARPHHPVQRLPAAVPGARARSRSTSSA